MMASEQIKKSRKKSATDNRKPDRGHPPDDASQNLKHVSKKRKREEKDGQGIKAEFVPHGSLVVPMKPAPPGALLNLVGTFLKSYDFHDTSRMYTSELALRRELDAWKSEMRVKPPNTLPDLVTLYQGWYKGHQRKAKADAKSLMSGESQATDRVPLLNKKGEKDKRTHGRADKTRGVEGRERDGDTSNDRSSVESSSDEEMEDVTPAKPERKKPTRSLSSSNSSSTSDSHADDEKEVSSKEKSLRKKGESRPSSKSKQKSSPKRSLISEQSVRSDPSEKKPNSKTKPQATEAVGISVSKIPETQKPRKIIKTAPSSSSSSSSSSTSSESSSAEEAVPDLSAQSMNKSVSDSEFSSSSSSSGDEACAPSKASNTTQKPTKKDKASEIVLPTLKSSTDSSVTVGNSPTKASVNAAVIAPGSSPKAAPFTSKRPFPTSADDEAAINTAKSVKKPRNAPFQRVPSDTEVDPKLASNAYRGHDYGDKAHEVLSLTRGKQFTKAKSKKKNRYSGGAIDISGGRAVKF